jgi:signal transduction histidine kinase
LKIFPNLNPLNNLKGEDVFSSLYGTLFFAMGFYLNFLRLFLDLDKFYPKFNRIMSFFEKILFLVGLMILIFGLFSLQHYSIKIFSFFNFVVPSFFLVTFIYLGTRKRTINRIMIAGTLVMMFAGRSQTLYYIFAAEQKFSVINFQIILFSLLVLFLFLNLGLLYKSKLVQDENMQKEIQRQSELSLQRAMISADLHDDLGASLSSIHLNAAMVQKSMHKDNAKADASLTRIVKDLKMVIENMGDIIWAINPDEKAHKSISGQLKDFYFDLMDGYGIHCNYHIDQALEARITNINARKNLLLIAKEAINNILKHAKSTRIDVFLKEQDNSILLEIQDNGIGIIDTEKTFSGSGLQNMKNRTEKINGVFKIKSEVGVGTTISCLVPLTNISYSHSIDG